MTFVIIGLIVGLVVGLTGAGGALVSIPLFITLLGISIKEATALSLIAVILGSGFSLFGRVKDLEWRTVLLLSCSGILANYVSLPLKAMASEVLIAALLILISTYSIWNVWGPGPQDKEGSGVRHHVTKALLAGCLLGITTTLTGLGGGVILIPMLIHIFSRNYEEALPTSLGSILLISLSAFLLQARVALSLASLSELLLIGSGTILAQVLLGLLLKKVDGLMIERMRKIVFTLVSVYSAISVMVNVK